MQRHALSSILALALLVSGACGKSPSEPSEPPPPVSALACENPALAATTAQPFDKVEVTGISGIGDETWVEYETAAGTKGLTAVVVDGEGKAQIVVPANPDSLMKSASLSCDSYQSPNLPPIKDTVSVVILRVEPDGTILPPTPSTIPIQVTCGPDSPNVDIDRLMIFDAPAQPEQKDHVMVLFQASNASYGALADAEGEANHTGYLRGYVSVKNEN